MLEDTKELLLNRLSKNEENLEQYKEMQEVFEYALEVLDDYDGYKDVKETFYVACLCCGIVTIGSLIVSKILEPLVGELIAESIPLLYISSSAIVFMDKLSYLLYRSAVNEQLDEDDSCRITERRKEVEECLREVKERIMNIQRKLINIKKQKAFVENSIGLEIVSEEKVIEFYNELREELNELLNEYLREPIKLNKVRFVDKYVPTISLTKEGVKKC